MCLFVLYRSFVVVASRVGSALVASPGVCWFFECFSSHLLESGASKHAHCTILYECELVVVCTGQQKGHLNSKTKRGLNVLVPLLVAFAGLSWFLMAFCWLLKAFCVLLEALRARSQPLLCYEICK